MALENTPVCRIVTVHGAAGHAASKLAGDLRNSGQCVVKESQLPYYEPNCSTILVASCLDIDVEKQLAGHSANSHVLVIVSNFKHPDVDTVKRLLLLGASDVLTESKECGKEVLKRLQRWHIVESLLKNKLVQGKIVGTNGALKSITRKLVEVSHFTNDAVLLCGESGTGKELFARLVHDLDSRSSKGNYVILDCTTILPELSGSEFFGHERGAFTGAFTGRDGAFALADRGTLFLDEIGELPQSLQAQLLRVIQEGTYRRVGSNIWHSTKFRLVCATNRNLNHEIKSGRFRKDLYYRVAQWTFTLPPLDQRREDVLPLARFFLQQVRTTDDDVIRFDKTVEDFLVTRSYPGNIRELKLLVSRLRLLHSYDGIITMGSLLPEELEPIGGNYEAKLENHIALCDAETSPGVKHNIKNIGNRAKFEAMKNAFAEELRRVNYDLAGRAQIFRRVADRLGCTVRWVQRCAKIHALFDMIIQEKSEK